MSGHLRLHPRDSGTETILFVEDDPDIARSLRGLLEWRGYTILGFNSAEAAIEAVRTHQGRLDILVTDVVLPGMGGAALAEEVRRLWPEIPVLFISGFMSGVIVPSDPDHPVGFIEKPFSGEELQAAVRRLLD